MCWFLLNCIFVHWFHMVFTPIIWLPVFTYVRVCIQVNLHFPNRIKVDIWLNRPYDGEFRCHYFLSFNYTCLRVNISYGWKVMNNFLIGNWMKIVCVMKAYLFHELYFVYVIRTFIAFKLKTLVQIHGFIFSLH